MTREEPTGTVDNKLKFTPLIPSRVVIALVSLGAAAMLLGSVLSNWVAVTSWLVSRGDPGQGAIAVPVEGSATLEDWAPALNRSSLVISFYPPSLTGTALGYDWWQYLLPVVAVLSFVGLALRRVPKKRIFWLGVAIAGIISFYPFYRLLNPGADILTSIERLNHELDQVGKPQFKPAGITLFSKKIAAPAALGFYITLAGTVLLTVGAFSALPGKRMRNELRSASETNHRAADTSEIRPGQSVHG